MGQIKKKRVKKVHEQHPAHGLPIAHPCLIGMTGHARLFL